MERQEIDPPFRPRIKEAGDVANFDKIFTDEKIQESINSINSTSNQFQKFDGFTFDQSPEFEITTDD